MLTLRAQRTALVTLTSKHVLSDLGGVFGDELEFRAVGFIDLGQPCAYRTTRYVQR